MKVGDLVKYDGSRPGPCLGLVMGFDKDGDPIVEFFDQQDMVSAAYYKSDIEVINESR
jgi:hypothetical protein